MQADEVEGRPANCERFKVDLNKAHGEREDAVYAHFAEASRSDGDRILWCVQGRGAPPFRTKLEHFGGRKGRQAYGVEAKNVGDSTFEATNLAGQDSCD